RKSVEEPPRARRRRSPIAPAKPLTTKNRGITCSTQVNAGYQAAPRVAYSSTGPSAARVTATWRPCTSITAATHRARTRSMPGSRWDRAGAAGGADGRWGERSVTLMRGSSSGDGEEAMNGVHRAASPGGAVPASLRGAGRVVLPGDQGAVETRPLSYAKITSCT